MSLVIAGSAIGATVISPVVALAASNCPTDTYPPSLVVDNHVTYVQVQIVAHCGIVREARAELILKRNGVVLQDKTVICTTSQGCNTNSVSVVITKACTSSNSSTFSSLYRTHPEDAFPWGPWVNLPVRVLNCSL